MAYQALLFCPEEKTARTVTQVLGELEFSVEPCSEPFAAVKKLMSQHFDAIVVDCDNEQNATLLFKSARNSASNQTSLAVAIVEGQAGVAKAFRIGANLVLTKPINVEQSKGTLRVARGLLRKGDPGKPVAPAASAASTASPAPQPAAPKASAPVKPPLNVAPLASARPIASVTVKPTGIPAAQTAVARTTPAPETKIGESTVLDSSVVPSAPVASTKATTPPAPTAPAYADPLELEPAAPVEKPRSIAPPEGPVGAFGGGAAAAAPAREPATVLPEVPALAVPVPPKPSLAAEDLFENPAEESKTASIPLPEAPQFQAEAAPLFSFGSGEEVGGGSKKIILGFVAVLAVAAGVYFGWSHFQGHAAQPATAATPAPVKSAPQQPVSTAPAKPSAQTPLVTQPETKSVAENLSRSAAPSDTADAEDSSSRSVSSSSKASVSSVPASKPAPKSAAEPLVVKGGTTPAIHQSAASVEPAAPSLVGIATAGSNGALSNIVSEGGDAPQPVLQTLKISQGVSQGLLLRKVQPVYPRTALTMRIEGAVELMATISKAGSITAVKVLRGEPQLSKAAVEAVKQWKYRPYKLDGQPVEIQTQITVVFKLPN